MHFYLGRKAFLKNGWFIKAGVQVAQLEENQPEPVIQLSAPHVSNVFVKAAERRQRRAAALAPTAGSLSIDTELHEYWNLVIAMQCASDPFQFWLRHEKTFKNLFLLAVDILSVPATSAPIERAFSVAGAALGLRRSSLSDQALFQEVFYKMNAFLLV